MKFQIILLFLTWSRIVLTAERGCNTCDDGFDACVSETQYARCRRVAGQAFLDHDTVRSCPGNSSCFLGVCSTNLPTTCEVCNICNDNGIACINSTAYVLCLNGEPQLNAVRICTEDQICDSFGGTPLYPCNKKERGEVPTCNSRGPPETTTSVPTTERSSSSEPTTEGTTVSEENTITPTTASSTVTDPGTSEPTTVSTQASTEGTTTTASSTVTDPSTSEPTTVSTQASTEGTTTTASSTVTDPSTSEPTTVPTSPPTTIPPISEADQAQMNKWCCQATTTVDFQWPNDPTCTIYVSCFMADNALTATLKVCDKDQHFSTVDRKCVPKEEFPCE